MNRFTMLMKGVTYFNEEGNEYGTVTSPVFWSSYQPNLHKIKNKLKAEKAERKNKMKKFFTIIAVVIMATLILSSCGSTNENTDENTDPDNSYTDPFSAEYVEKTMSSNPIFVYIGDAITIDGVTYTAQMVSVSYSHENFVTSESSGDFYVNTITRDVYFVYICTGSTRSSYAFSTPLGVKYTDALVVNGVTVLPAA